MDPELVLEQALAAIQAGANADAVDEVIGSVSDFPNLFALQNAVEASFEAQAAEELAEIGEAPVRNFLGAAAQGATFGFADELVGLASPEAGERMRRAQDIREERAPGASALSQIAGGIMLPAIPAIGASRAAPGVLRGAATGLGRGGLFGALGGAAAGAGFAEEGQRAEAAREGALFGGLTGAALGVPFGAVGGLFGAAAGRGTRVAEKMGDLSGLDNLTLASAKGAVGLEKLDIQQTLYQPIQQANQAVDDPAILGFLTDVAIDPNLKTLIPRQFRPGQQRLPGPTGQRGGVIVRGQEINMPSFQDLQDVRNSLRSRAFNRAGDLADREALARADELTELMEDAFGPALREADSAWARVSANERAIDQGWRRWNIFGQEVDELIQTDAFTPDQWDNFNRGRLARITAEMQQRNKEPVSALRKFLDMGPDARRSVGSMFPGGPDGPVFGQLERMLAGEARTAAIADFFNSTIKSGAIGATGGAITGGIMSGRGSR